MSETKKDNYALTIEQTIALLLRDREHKFEGNESDFEKIVHENLEELCQLLFLSPIKELKIKREINNARGKSIPDILIIHEDMTLSVFEVKCYGSPGYTEQVRAVGQLLYYSITVSERYGVNPRLFLIDWKIDHAVFSVCQQNKLPISLIELNGDSVFMPYAFNHHIITQK